MGTVQALALVKRTARRLAAELYARSPGFLKRLEGKATILTYHRVVTAQELSRERIQPGMYVTAEMFERHLTFLQRHFTVLAFPELLDLWNSGRWDCGARYCVVTFDDGWLDNYRYAFPILKAHRVPATLFLPTAFIGTNHWFWPERIGWLCERMNGVGQEIRLHVEQSLERTSLWSDRFKGALSSLDIDQVIECCKTFRSEQIDQFAETWAQALRVKLPNDRQVINWDEAKDMSRNGISFGSHSVSHEILTTLPHDAVVREVTDSWLALRGAGIGSLPVFCYPNGDWSEEIARAVQAAGYAAATTTEFGHEGSQPQSMFGLKRINIHQDITSTDALFGFHLAGLNHLHA